MVPEADRKYQRRRCSLVQLDVAAAVGVEVGVGVVAPVAVVAESAEYSAPV